MSLIACLSGPERTRAKVEVALEDARIPQLPDDHHGMMDWPAKLAPYASDEAEKAAKKHKRHGPQGFITIHLADAAELNAVVVAVEPHGWVLRVHYPEPPASEPSPEMKLAATVEEMHQRIAALEARAGAR